MVSGETTRCQGLAGASGQSHAAVTGRQGSEKGGSPLAGGLPAPAGSRRGRWRPLTHPGQPSLCGCRSEVAEDAQLHRRASGAQKPGQPRNGEGGPYVCLSPPNRQNRALGYSNTPSQSQCGRPLPPSTHTWLGPRSCPSSQGAISPQPFLW